MTEIRLFDGAAPVYTTPDWYATRERAPHLEQPGHRERLLATAQVVNAAIERHDIRTVSDLGCGDGGLLSLVDAPVKWGYDLQATNIEGARERGMNVALADVVARPWVIAHGGMSLCTEMLEHLVDPHEFLRNIRSRVVVASSPATETTGVHYEFHTYAWDMDGYAALFERAGYEVEHHDCAGPFQILVGVKP